MNILINASNLRTGGGLQVADSICRELYKFNHNFIVLLPSVMRKSMEAIKYYHNVTAIGYDSPLSIKTILTGRDRFLDDIVKKKKIDRVLTVFGPSRWKPKCFHLCGFAMPHIVLNDSPYWEKFSLKSKLLSAFRNKIMSTDFKNKNNGLWCENEYITQRLKKKYPNKEIHTISNNCNQIYYDRSSWDNSITLPKFNGLTLLTITSNYPHKNLRIAVDALEIIRQKYPELNIRFVFTIKESDFGSIPDNLRQSFVFLGPIPINQCPHLYEQASIMFQPSLLECFSATYPEAMLMKKPIITTDLGFAHSLCGEAACYYTADDPSALADAIQKLASNKDYRENLVTIGLEQVKKFDSFEDRARKLIEFITKE